MSSMKLSPAIIAPIGGCTFHHNFPTRNIILLGKFMLSPFHLQVNAPIGQYLLKSGFILVQATLSTDPS